jgi:hypothetical protein
MLILTHLWTFLVTYSVAEIMFDDPNIAYDFIGTPCTLLKNLTVRNP